MAQTSSESTRTDAGERPKLLIVANAPSPYRISQHRRFAHEIPEFELHSIFMQRHNIFSWELEDAPEINAVYWGDEEAGYAKQSPKNALREWRKGGRVIRWIKEHEPAAVSVLGYDDAGRLRLLRWLRKNHVPHFVFGDSNVHGDASAGVRRGLKRRVVGAIARGASAMLVCGRFGIDFFGRYGARAHKCCFVPHEPDYTKFDRVTGASIASALDKHGLEAGRKKLLFVGRLVAFKRPAQLARAFAAIAEQRPEWDLVIVGDGPARDAVERAAGGLLGDRVRMLGAVLDQNELASIYKACDAFVLPSFAEPWGVVTVEAAKAGLAIITSDSVGSADLVEEGVNGRVFRTDDEGHLSEVILDVTAHAERMREATPGVFARWRERCDQVLGMRRALWLAGLLPGEDPYARFENASAREDAVAEVTA